MSAFSTSLYLVAVALCLFSTGLTTRAARGQPYRFFTFFLVIQSVVFLCELLIAHPATPFKALWLALLMSSSLLLAPCLWLTFRESIAGERPELRALPRPHGLAILAGLLFTVPLALSAHAGTSWMNPADPSSWLESKITHTTMLLCIGIFVVQVPWYLRRCRGILLERLGGQRDHWAQLPLAIVLTSWTLAIVRTIDCAFIKWPAMFTVVVAVISVGVTIGALYLLLRQFGALTKERAGTYAKSPLGAGARARIRRKLASALQDEAIYSRSDLTLRALCESLNESPHYVSQVISQDLEATFYDLLNQRRIEAAMRRLREAPEEGVLEIAMAVGFNSKSAFNAAFRRVTGTTPSEYRKFPGKSPDLEVLADQEGRQVTD